MFGFIRKKPKVEFLINPEDKGVIPLPYAASKYQQDWFKKLSPKINGDNKLENSTIKRCMPFLDAMNTGWIIPLAADVEIVTNNDASGLEYKWSFYRPMIENHNIKQIDGHPSNPKPPLKFLNHVLIKIPKGYSALFVPPLNRPDQRFECISGLVDDTYMGNGALEYINFPFIFKEPNYTGIIKQGTPLVQMILIKREKEMKHFELSCLSKEDEELLELTRKRRKAHESYYRDVLRQPK